MFYLIVKNKREETINVNSRVHDEQNEERQRRKDDFRLINLAVKWNYIDGVLPILQSRHHTMKTKDSKYNEVRLTILKMMNYQMIIIGRNERLQTNIQRLSTTESSNICWIYACSWF